MKSTITLTSVCVFLLTAPVFLFSQTSVQCGAEKIVMPIEVLGAEGVTEARCIRLNQQTASQVKRLWLQVNNLSYEGKASVRINNGSWYSLTNNSVDMQPQAKARGGMVHGGFNTIRFSIPVTGIIAGDNTVRFRFNKSDGISIGYRVINMTFQDSNGTALVPNSRFYHEDPNTWDAPIAGQTAINKGKDLWNNANLWNHYLPSGKNGSWYGQKLPSTRPMKAKCASCHTQDGRDLELFSYSNKSIIERAKFHKLSEEQGKQIASYIRSLSRTKPNVNRHGRPWNPPYQPGPSLKNKPIEYWAAGAGLQAVLEEDKDMLPHLFPNGVSKETVLDYFDSDKMDDRTILPIAIQFPDWKHWLPMIHPVDAYSKNNYFENPNRKNKPQKAIDDLRNYLAEQAPATRNKKELMHKIYHLWPAFRGFLAEGSAKVTGGDHWRTKDGSALKHLGVDVPKEFAATSLARLLAVKNFEFNVEYDLQDKAKWFVDPADQPSERQWPNKTYSVFEVPAHFQGCVDNTCQNFTGQPIETGRFESTAWYNLQFVLNGGNGFAGSVVPTDFNYHAPFILRASESAGIPEPLRYYSSLNQMYQIRSWSGSKEGPGSGGGFKIRNQGPWYFYGIDDANFFFKNGNDSWLSLLDEIRPGMSLWVLEAQLLQFLKEVNKPENDLRTWPRIANGGSVQLDLASKSSVRDISTFIKLGFHADKMHYLIPKFKAEGVDCKITNALIDWSEKAWPLINWRQFREDPSSRNCITTPTPPTTGGGTQSAFKTHRIPGLIQAEDFDNGGQGVAYYDATSQNEGGKARVGEAVGITTTSDAGGGNIIGWTRNNEWLEYTIATVKAGTYDIVFRGASNVSSAKSIKATLGSTNLGTMAINQTAGWQSFENYTLKNVTITKSASNQVLRLAINGGLINLNWVRFIEKESTQPPVVPTSSAQLIANGQYRIKSKVNGATIASTRWSYWKAVEINEANYDDQKWNFKHLGNNVYVISLVGNGRNLEVPHGRTANGTLVESTTHPAVEEHIKWKISKIGANYFFRPNHDLTKAMDIRPSDNKVHIWSYSTSNKNQYWDVVPVSGAKIIDTQLQLYPTLADDKITILGLGDGTHSAIIFDQSGKRLLTQTINSNSSNTLDVSMVASGLYFVRILGAGEKAQLLKFVKR